MKSHAIFAVKVLAVMLVANKVPAISGIVTGNKYFK